MVRRGRKALLLRVYAQPQGVNGLSWAVKPGPNLTQERRMNAPAGTSRLPRLLAALGCVIHGKRRMHLGFDMGRNQSALEQPLGLHRVLLGAVDMRLHLRGRHETHLLRFNTGWNLGAAKRIREVADRPRMRLMI